MFTGIIEAQGEILHIESSQRNLIFKIRSDISPTLKIDQSVAHDGVCLTVTHVDTEKQTHTVAAIAETLEKSNLGNKKVGNLLNLERCMRIDSRLDGHIVQGHVDMCGICTEVKDDGGSWRFYFDYDKNSDFFTVPKGSICINGVSLTVVDSAEGKLSVAIIPYTYEHTNFHELKVGDAINLEFDIIGKYVQTLWNRRPTDNPYMQYLANQKS
ncbi:MAG: riboflavin synthase [Bernardetiaceae bacterium]|nr:riboflavin synthase [Bernardetiaceae bacterium]